MMPVIHHAIDVDAPPDACWRAFADLRRWPVWFPFLVEARAVEPEPFRIGGQLDLSFEVSGVRVTVRTTIEELTVGTSDQPRWGVRWVGSKLGVRGDHAYRFEQTRATPPRTRVTCHEEWSGLPTKLMPDALVARLDDESHASLQKFAALVLHEV